jgi:peptidoglycan-N-acetylglucosamine deacetylase
MRFKRASAILTVVSLAAFGMATTAGAASRGSAPVVKTLAAATVMSTSATFFGTVNPGGMATTAWFQWQPPDGNVSTTRSVGSGTTAVGYSSTITGLKPSTTYKFEAAAVNSRGIRYGAFVSFRTLDVQPTKIVYLTFDDGPTAGYTNEVLTDLNAAGAHATFFEIGASTFTSSGMQKNPSLPSLLLANGEQIGTHGWDHPDFRTITDAQAASEISTARNFQLSLTGHDSKLFRFPYNQSTTGALSYLNSQGMRAVGFDIAPDDWDATVPDSQINSAIMAQVSNGAVIELHDGQDVLGRDGGHPGYLPSLLSQLKAAGYSFSIIPSV